MNNTPISVYTQVYNAEKYNINYIQPIQNYLDFLDDNDEIVIAINQSEDDTYNLVNDAIKNIKARSSKKTKLITVPTDFSYSDIEFDGKVKNEALQISINPIKIQMDIDEYFDLNQRDKWRMVANILNEEDNPDCYLIPSIDLWGSLDKIRKNVIIGRKFRIHKSGFFRGVANFARREDGTIDTSMSDSTELIDQNGSIPVCQNLCPEQYLAPEMSKYLQFFTLHMGYVSYSYRENIDNFWRPHWQLRCGGRKKDEPQTVEKLSKEETIEHEFDFKLH